jgi:multidrug efflux system membrane fusion protein
MLVRTIAGAVVVPVTAVRHGSSGPYVYVLNPAERTVSLRAVEVGEATVDRVQIARGLEAGEVVITEGADRLKDGASVTLPGDAPGARGGARGQGDDATKGKGGARGEGGKARQRQPAASPQGVRRPREGEGPASAAAALAGTTAAPA